jgi:hypothetical protein
MLRPADPAAAARIGRAPRPTQAGMPRPGASPRAAVPLLPERPP